MSVKIHPTAIVEDGVILGDGTSVWDNVHIRQGTTLGDECIVGGKSTIAYDVRIGHRVKINSAAYICHGVTLQDGVMVSAGVIFTNDRFPRATTADLLQLRDSSPDEHTLQTLVCEGSTIGAGAMIGCDLTIGRFAMIGMGAVVTKSVPDFHLVVGSPARSIAAVCRCGQPVHRFAKTESNDENETETEVQRVQCDCGRVYAIDDRIVTEVIEECGDQSESQ